MVNGLRSFLVFQVFGPYCMLRRVDW